jgi:hypothetical protein
MNRSIGAAIVLFVLLPTSTWAQNASPVLSAYLEQMRPFTKNTALAAAASQCGLRSEAYLNRFMMAQQLAGEKYMRQFQVPSSDYRAMDNASDNILKETIAAVTCRSLRNSPALDALDATERKLTGNYR